MYFVAEMFGGGGGVEAARATLSIQVDAEPARRQPASCLFIFIVLASKMRMLFLLDLV